MHTPHGVSHADTHARSHADNKARNKVRHERGAVTQQAGRLLQGPGSATGPHTGVHGMHRGHGAQGVCMGARAVWQLVIYYFEVLRSIYLHARRLRQVKVGLFCCHLPTLPQCYIYSAVSALQGHCSRGPAALRQRCGSGRRRYQTVERPPSKTDARGRWVATGQGSVILAPDS